MSRQSRRADTPSITVEGFERTERILGRIFLISFVLLVVAFVGWILNFDVFRLVVGAGIVFGVGVVGSFGFGIYLFALEAENGYRE